MKQVILYSIFLFLGILFSQGVDLTAYSEWISNLTRICLAYIMIEVGLEFKLEKNKLKSYGWDSLISVCAAVLPWFLASAYFITIFHTPWKEAVLIGVFAAPTSAGLLLAMLNAAGLHSTWVFSKARTLVIFDDLATVFFMIPLQLMIMGFRLKCLVIIIVIIAFLAAAYKWLHKLRLPVGKGWLLIYGVGIVSLSEWIRHADLLHHLEVLIPGFVLGCILSNSEKEDSRSLLENDYSMVWANILDKSLKTSFMLFVGLSIPKVPMGSVPIVTILSHVLILTLICNIGKCVPLVGYLRSASLRERLALSVALFPRGEVGAGVLLIALSYGFGGLPATLAGLSLAVNLLMTGFFIYVVKILTRRS